MKIGVYKAISRSSSAPWHVMLRVWMSSIGYENLQNYISRDFIWYVIQ